MLRRLVVAVTQEESDERVRRVRDLMLAFCGVSEAMASLSRVDRDDTDEDSHKNATRALMEAESELRSMLDRERQ